MIYDFSFPADQKTLVIPDVHNKIERADELINKYSPQVEKIVFLGDYFDSWGDNTNDLEKTARWLKNHLNNPKIYFLVGNHDLSYIGYVLNNKSPLTCPGWNTGKLARFHDIFPPHVLKKQKFYWFGVIGDIFLSHAPMDNYYFNIINTVDVKEKVLSKMRAEATQATQNLLSGKAHWFWHAPHDQNPSPGGILWNRIPIEFTPVPGVASISGHTIMDFPKVFYKNHWCIDTDLRSAAIVHNNRVEIVY